MNIVAIGGGQLGQRETLRIDRFIVGLTKKRVPRALFIPTASGDAPGYCRTFEEIYGKTLGCRTDNLHLLGCDANPSVINNKIEQADLIYVGGGNTLRMMRRWRQFGVDRLLEKAGKTGTVLSGLSAGAICWHQWGHSDSRSFSGNSGWTFIRVRGLGLAKGLFCPHRDVEKRHRPFKEMVARFKVTGIACDNHAAVYYSDLGAQCITSRKEARVHVYRPVADKIIVTQFKDGERIER